MSTGTSLFDFMDVFLARLEARPGLAEATVYDAYPSADGVANDAIWFGGAETDSEISAMRAGRKKVDEDVIVDVVVQCLKKQGEGQRAADNRARELLAEVQQELAETPQPTEDIHWAELVGWELKRGPLPTTGHGCRFECKVKVKARLF